MSPYGYLLLAFGKLLARQVTQKRTNIPGFNKGKGKGQVKRGVFQWRDQESPKVRARARVMGLEHGRESKDLIAEVITILGATLGRIRIMATHPGGATPFIQQSVDQERLQRERERAWNQDLTRAHCSKVLAVLSGQWDA